MKINFVARLPTGEREVVGIPDDRLPDILRIIGNQIVEGQYSGRVTIPKSKPEGGLVFEDGHIVAGIEVWWRIE